MLALLAIALLDVGCSDEPAAAPKAPVRSKFEWAVIRGISEQLKKIEDAPGRTGILAQKSKYSLFSEELIIRDFFQDRRDGFFVDVGCAWPIGANNTYYLEKHLGWTGIGIDALGDYAAAWQEERRASKFFNFIVSDHVASSAPFFKSNLLGLSSVDRESASGETFGQNAPPEEIEVPMTTLDSLLDAEGIEKIDLLAMDIEGHEATALAGFDIDRFQPELIVTEGQDPKVLSYLIAHGYEQIQRYLAHDPVNRYFRPKAGPGEATLAR